MSTRALYTFADDDGEYHVYKHHDGYPEGEHGGINTIKKALLKAWPLPRFEADDFAAAFVAANKEEGGGVRLTTGKTWEEAAPADIEYHYVVTAPGGVLRVACYATNCWDTPTQTLLNEGLFGKMHVWALAGAKPVKAKKARKVAGPVVVAVPEAGSHRTGDLPSSITPAQIKKVLGFKANVDDDGSKVKHSWGFTVDGKQAGIWDYKGSRWSVYDPHGVVPPLFRAAGLL